MTSDFLPKKHELISGWWLWVTIWWITMRDYRMIQVGPLIFVPQRRAEVWRFLTYQFLHAGWVLLLEGLEFLSHDQEGSYFHKRYMKIRKPPGCEKSGIICWPFGRPRKVHKKILGSFLSLTGIGKRKFVLNGKGSKESDPVLSSYRGDRKKWKWLSKSKCFPMFQHTYFSHWADFLI